MSANHSPLELLLSYQQRVLTIRADMPVVHTEREEWTGLAFRLGQQVFVSSMSDIEEIVDQPECSNVPNTKNWFLGIGNVRGNLIPVSDLHSFVHGEKSTSRREGRVLTCASGDTTVGLVVDEILGLRRFYVDEQTDNTTELPEAMGEYVDSAFQRDAAIYPVFQIKQFVHSNAFLQVAR